MSATLEPGVLAPMADRLKGYHTRYYELAAQGGVAA